MLDPPRRKEERLRWARAQAEAGVTLHDFAMFSKVLGAGAHFLSAAALLEAALEILRPKTHLDRWARTQMELAEVWENMGGASAGAEALAARRRGAAILEETLAELEGRKPRLRANLQRQLGGALRRLGEIEAGREAREALLASVRAYEAAIALEQSGKPIAWIWRWLSQSRHALHLHAQNAEEARIWLRGAVEAMERSLAALEPSGAARRDFPDQTAWEQAIANRGGASAPLIRARFQDHLGDLLLELAAREEGAAEHEALRKAAAAWADALALGEAHRSGSGWLETRAKLDELQIRLAGR